MPGAAGHGALAPRRTAPGSDGDAEQGRPEGKGGGYTLRLDPIEAVTPKELRIGEVGRGVFRNGEAGDGKEAQAGSIRGEGSSELLLQQFAKRLNP